MYHNMTNKFLAVSSNIRTKFERDMCERSQKVSLKKESFLSASKGIFLFGSVVWSCHFFLIQKKKKKKIKYKIHY